jgi:hypothetical protein
MKPYTSFVEFIDNTIAIQNNFGFSKWTLVKLKQLSDSEIKPMNLNGLRSPQSKFLATIADPITQQTREVLFVDNEYSEEMIIAACHQYFLNDVTNRVRGMLPEKNRGFYEYEALARF